ncbi:hypothetical protein [Streptomyces hirsutus]|uniref:hypothetical protein n=1 Tax=Streptomyces hirsutus TaxID=35620 RepID=UPI0036756FFB
MSARAEHAEHAERVPRGLRAGHPAVRPSRGEAGTVTSASGTEILRHVHHRDSEALESRKPYG